MKQLYPHEAMSAVSARAEWTLCQARRRQEADYITGAPSFTALSQAPHVSNGCATWAEVSAAVAAVQLAEAILRGNEEGEPGVAHGGTGVAEAINAAVALAPPLLVYPVGDLQTCVSVPMEAPGCGCSAAVLSHCLLMKPGSAPEDVFNTLKRAPLQALAGDYIRAECLDMVRPSSGSPRGFEARLMKKTEAITFATRVLRIMTNRKSAWQHQLASA
jgi:hypothetical protein